MRRLAFPLLLALVGFIGLVVARQQMDSAWIPRGTDWDTWYLSALWWGHAVPFPGNRWPLYGLVTALSPFPGPLHIRATLVSMAAVAAAAGALGALARRLGSAGAGLAVAALTLLNPFTFELANWMSAYPLWAACGLVGAVAMGAAVRENRGSAWLIAGLGAGGTLAAMGAGLPGGMGLLGLGLGSAAWRGGRRAVGAFLAPVGLLALLYAVFPVPLTPLDKQMFMPEEAAVDTAAAVDLSQIDERALMGGYIFGRRMDPFTLARTVQHARLLQADPAAVATRRARSVRMVAEAFPGADGRFLPWMAGGAAIGLGAVLVRALGRGGRRAALGDGVALVGLLGVAAAVLPAMDSNLNLRFLAPALFLAPFLLVLPFAALLRPFPLLRQAPILLAPLLWWPNALFPQSPFRDGEAVHAHVVGGGAELDTTVWYALQGRYPGLPVDVHDPMRGGAFALDGREGRFLDPNGSLADNGVAADHLVLIWDRSGAVNADHLPVSTAQVSTLRGDAGAAGRMVVEVWPVPQPPFGQLLLLGPAGAGAR